MGEYEPNDSRNVTGTGSSPDGRWTGQDQQEPTRAGNQQMQQGQQGGSQGGSGQSGGQMGGASDQSIEFEPDPQLSQGAGSRQQQQQGHQGAASEGQYGHQQGQMGQQSAPQQNMGGSQGSIGMQNDGVSGRSNQQNDHTSGIGGSGGQEQQFQARSGQMGGGGSGAGGQFAQQIREHMEVVDQSGNHVGTVDCVQGDEIVLTKHDSPSGEHRRIPMDQVSGIQGGRVTLNSRGGA